METSASKSPILTFKNCFTWLSICVIVGTIVGCIGAGFLLTLQWATNTRDANHWLVFFLPPAGFFIGWIYHNYGNRATKGNNLLLEEFHRPKQIIPLRMALLVYMGTILTHLFGGSAGREGTAVQMGGAIADQLYKVFKLQRHHRKLLLVLGISAGFAAVFGTPVAGAFFAIEVMAVKFKRYRLIVPSLLVAFVANYVCQLFPVAHTHYPLATLPVLHWKTVLAAMIAGVCFGWATIAFSKAMHFFSRCFSKIKYPPLRPFVGGIILSAIVFGFGMWKYIGLGIPTIVHAFEQPAMPYHFAIKLLLTALTLGAGFKGGEVTPLFFIGATLGSALSTILPLPHALLAAMGFVAVFSGATNTPMACSLMGLELFGLTTLPYLAIACLVAYLCSGKKGIYAAQRQSYIKRLIIYRLNKRWSK